MLNPVLSLVTSIAVGLLLGGSAERQCPVELESSVVDTVKHTSAQRLEEALADEPLEKWFQALVGKGVEVCWETNDCGEQTGDPSIDHSRDIPICVQAWAPESSAGWASFTVAVGNHREGLHGDPRLRDVLLESKEGVERIESLAELSRRIKTRWKPVL